MSNEVAQCSREMTVGEQRVRTQFNPSAKDVVSQIKQKSAELIDLVMDLKKENSHPEVARLLALAATAFEEGSMWAVKGATAGK